MAPLPAASAHAKKVKLCCREQFNSCCFLPDVRHSEYSCVMYWASPLSIRCNEWHFVITDRQQVHLFCLCNCLGHLRAAWLVSGTHPQSNHARKCVLIQKSFGTITTRLHCCRQYDELVLQMISNSSSAPVHSESVADRSVWFLVDHGPDRHQHLLFNRNLVTRNQAATS